MSNLLVLIIAILAFFLAYRFYASFISKVVGINDKNITPAHKKYDGLDYIPARNWLVLFGHHFSSIAGAGPIVGPILVCIWWGWVPAILWAILGSIFIGGVHDFLSLAISSKEEGNSIGKISETFISKSAGIIFLIFVWFALLLVVAVFALVCAKTFIEEPRIILPSLGIIPVALLIGVLLYRFNLPLSLTTVIGLSLLALFIFLGQNYYFNLSKNTWIVILFIYAFFASITPVNILLQPRDYLSSFLLWFGLLTMSIGVITSPQQITYPALKSFVSPKGGWLFPMMFITMACGAISGFHSLVASGTTSKQLPQESDAKKIGYLGMLSEGLLAILVVLCVIAGASVLKVNPQKLSSGSAIKIFSQGYNFLTNNFLKGQGGFLAIIILNAFILTTLDTATRITRYVTQELFRIKNKIGSTFVVLLTAFLLILSGSWEKLWQLFGASNQLLASLTLFVVSAWLLTKKRKYLFAFIPGVFMLLISFSALILKAGKFLKEDSKNYFLFTITLILIILGIFMFIEVIKKRKDFLKRIANE